MADLTQAERKLKEARTVAWLGRAIGVSGLGLTGALTALTSAQGQDSLLFQSRSQARVANYESAPPTVTEITVEVPVASPLPPTHIPVLVGGGSSGGAGGGAGSYRQPVAGPQAAPPVPGAPPAAVVRPPVAKPPPVPQPVPSATSTGSVPH